MAAAGCRDLEPLQVVLWQPVAEPVNPGGRKPKGNGDVFIMFKSLSGFRKEPGGQKAERQWRREIP